MEKKQTIKLACFLVSCCIAIANGRAQEFGTKAEARYAITSGNMVDPEPDPHPDRVAIYLEGASAEEIFRAMPEPAKNVDCDGQPMTRMLTKVAGGLECFRDEKQKYSCSVAIMLDSGKTARGYVCD